MADGTKAGGDAPRTLFSLGRSGKRKGRAAESSPLEDYPPRHADESVTDDEVSPLEAIEGTDIEAAHAELLRDDADSASDLDISDLDSLVDDTSADLDDQACPSCSEPLVAGAMFCGECGTRVTTGEDSAPAAVLLDDEVPGEPLPPEPEGAFEVAEPVTGSFEDDELLDADDLAEDDRAEDDGAHLEEQAVFGAFIAADDVAEADTDVEVDADADVEAEVDAEADVEAEADTEVDADETDLDADETDLIEDETDADLAAEDEAEVDAEADVEVDEPDAELVEEDAELVDEADVVEDPAEAELVEEADEDAAPVVPIAAATTAAAADGSGGGSKKGVWIGVAAAAAAVVLIIGVVALSSGGKDGAEKDDQVASTPQKSTTTTAASSTTALPTTTVAPSTTDTSAPVVTDTSAVPSTDTTSAPATNTTGKPFVPPPVTSAPPASGPNVQVSCPPTLAPGGHYAITLHNAGGTQTSFLVTWSALKTGVTVSPTTGTVGAGANATVNVNVANGTPGSASRVTIKWSGGSTSCNLLVQ